MDTWLFILEAKLLPGKEENMNSVQGNIKSLFITNSQDMCRINRDVLHRNPLIALSWLYL